ncbi:unknown [Bacteroides sp. CAG:1060]|nr:unknown [Bacteroides sp. CAG:1060]
MTAPFRVYSCFHPAIAVFRLLKSLFSGARMFRTLGGITCHTRTYSVWTVSDISSALPLDSVITTRRWPLMAEGSLYQAMRKMLQAASWFLMQKAGMSSTAINYRPACRWCRPFGWETNCMRAFSERAVSVYILYRISRRSFLKSR